MRMPDEIAAKARSLAHEAAVELARFIGPREPDDADAEIFLFETRPGTEVDETRPEVWENHAAIMLVHAARSLGEAQQ